MLSLSLRLSSFSSNNLGRTSMPILDREGRLVAVLARHPDDESWPDLSKQTADLLEEARGRCLVAGRIAPKMTRFCWNCQKLPFSRNSGFATGKHSIHW